MNEKINWTNERFLTEIHDYKYLIENFMTTDATDRTRGKDKKNWQIKCNDYFHNSRLAQRLGKRVLQKHYELLELYKNQPNSPTFKDALQNLYDHTGCISPFLASQVAHFFNTDMPICSRFVLDGLNTVVSVIDIETACKEYEHLTQIIHKFRDDKGKEIIADFKKAFESVPRIIKNFSDTKIIDFYFWFVALNKGE